MKIYTYSQARQRFATVLEEAKREEVVIRRQNGDQFRIVPRKPETSPFDIPSIRTEATTQDILDAIRESRERS